MRRWGTAAVLGIVAAGMIAWWQWTAYLDSPAAERSQAVFFRIPPRATFRQVTETLVQKGLIRSPWMLRIYGRIMGYGKRLQAGEYRLAPDITPRKLLELFVEGRIHRVRAVIPEGSTLRDIARELERLQVVDAEEFLRLAKDPRTAAALGLPGPTLEGYLFPDTYLFTRHTPPRNVIARMAARWKQVFDPFRDRCKAVGLSPRQAMTLASLIEKETGRESERPLVSSVFWNRMRRGMRLQSDPSVLYGLGDFRGPLTRTLLRTDTSYNTYTRPGLPPGPIACPGISSIRAALYPASTEFLYFVADPDGFHHFSKTLQEHNRYVLKLRKNTP